MNTTEFSRAAGRVMNAPYWYQEYPNNDPTGCVQFHEGKRVEKQLLADACDRVVQGGGNLDSLPPAARLVWDKAAQTFVQPPGS